MLINLVCSSQLKELLTEFLKAKGLFLSSDAKVTILEKGFEFPHQGLSIVFEYATLNDLIGFLDMLAKKPESSKNVISAKRLDSEKYEIISYENIMYFEAEGNNVYCFTVNDKYRVKNKLYELETNLYEQGFIRVGKSILVNIMSVTEIIPWFGSRLLLKLKNQHEIEVARNYVKNFKDFLEL